MKLCLPGPKKKDKYREWAAERRENDGLHHEVSSAAKELSPGGAEEGQIEGASNDTVRIF